MFDLKKYLDLLVEVKAAMQIGPSGQSNESARRRITISCVDTYLSAGGNTRDAYFFEASLFAATHDQHLSCRGLLPEEIRLKGIGRFGKDTSDCLKLLSEGCLLTPKMDLTQKTMEVLLNETKSTRNRRSKHTKNASPQKANYRKRPDRHPSNLKVESRKIERKRPTLYRNSQGQKDVS